MKKFLIIIVLTIVFSEAYSQRDSFSHFDFDSVQIDYCNTCFFVEVKIIVTRDSISFYQVIDRVLEENNIVNKFQLIYKISRKEIIVEYYSVLKGILNKDPIYEEDGFFVECVPWITFKYHIRDTIIEKRYSLESDAMFPFSFTKLFYMIIPVIEQKVIPMKEN